MNIEIPLGISAHEYSFTYVGCRCLYERHVTVELFVAERPLAVGVEVLQADAAIVLLPEATSTKKSLFDL